MKKKNLVRIYLLAIHLLLLLLIARSDFMEILVLRLGYVPDEIDAFHLNQLEFHKRVDKNLRPGVTLFFGDSHVQGLAVSSVTGHSANFGIGGDTTIGLLRRLPYYGSTGRAKSIVISIGFNDLKRRSNDEILDRLGAIVGQLPRQVPVILCAVKPVDEKASGRENINRRIYRLNEAYASIAERHSHVFFVGIPAITRENGSLAPEYHIGDGIHLSREGYSIWIDQLQQALATYTVKKDG